MNPLYTTGLTPRTDIPEELARMIFEGEPSQQGTRVRVHFDRLEQEDRNAVVAYCEELDCLH